MFYESDPFLRPFKTAVLKRTNNISQRETVLTRDSENLADFASGHNYYGLHFSENKWIFREWAPNAVSVCLIGETTGWQEKTGFSLKRINEDGVWEIVLPAETLKHGDPYRLRIRWPGGEGDRIPVYAKDRKSVV